MNSRRRLFFALEPNDAVRDEIYSVQQASKANGRAVTPNQFHATLAFLGMQPADVIPALQRLSSELTLEPCSICLDHLGQFRRAGVLWLGSTNLPPALEAFHLSLLTGLEGAGIDRDRKPWQFHITLYRRLRMSPDIMSLTPVIWPLDGFSLIESVGVKNGVEYHRHGHWKCSSSDDRL